MELQILSSSSSIKSIPLRSSRNGFVSIRDENASFQNEAQTTRFSIPFAVDPFTVESMREIKNPSFGFVPDDEIGKVLQYEISSKESVYFAIDKTTQTICYIYYTNAAFYASLMQPICHIIDNVYIGNLYAAIDEETLQTNQIRSIVQVFDGFDPVFADQYDYLVIHIDDSIDVSIKEYFPCFVDFLDGKVINQSQEGNKTGGNVLIHCQHGSSRSGTFVVFYLMYFHRMTFEEALRFARSKRLGIFPNPSFQRQLKEYFETLSR